jgi:hypothetical protein
MPRMNSINRVAAQPKLKEAQERGENQGSH